MKRGACAAGQESEDSSWNGDLAVWVGDAVEEGAEVDRLIDRQFVWRVQEGEGGLGPAQEAYGLEPSEWSF